MLKYLPLGLFIVLALASSRLQGASQKDFEACQQVADLDKSIDACGIIINDKNESIGDRALMHLRRGYAFLAEGDLTRAILDFDTSIALGPGDVYAYLNRALALYRAEEKSQAAADYRWAQELERDKVAAMTASSEDLLSIRDVSLKAGKTTSDVSTELKKSILAVETHLASHPEDGRGFEVIGPIYVRIGRDRDALRARREALRLLGPTAQRQADLGQALTTIHHGLVVEEAHNAFERALALDPQHLAARFYLGLASAQHDDKQRAREAWNSVLRDAPDNAQIRALIERQLAALGEGRP